MRDELETGAVGIVCLFLGLILLLVLGIGITRAATQAEDKEVIKLVALADKMILASKRLSSTQDPNELAIIDEFVPLADYVVKTLGKK